ncbi:hypothetical protein [Haloplanus aerogenes]|uniref:Uncharacterized protein n=1 Tax=Haloplanus aerogenes TaxID=660522 RepID=A0A3M0DYU1_9EURY|nr:hypothetical protein [Haloplanus aerogenes]AZH25444.1 hypothetical protein DU502_08650 [Haloplanus aerogenes]RMB25156.1 hypothetical protein ATH50_0239 [Haloplanus aerogenes]
MPEIEITPEQQERLRELQEDLARDVVGKYGHVRPRDAVEYLLDRYESDESTDGDASVASPAAENGNAETVDDGSGESEADNASDDVSDSDGGATARVVTEDGDPTDGSGGDDAMLNEMMSLLDTHDDKWGESSGDERYEVELPDGSTEQVRTKDDVKALLFKHYR